MLAVEVRSGLVEATHHGAFAAFDANLDLVAHSGDIDTPFFLRSSSKPFQTFVSQEFGAELSPIELAVASSSHDGFPVHIAIVDAMLQRGGLSQDHLQCPPLWPLALAARDVLVSRGNQAPRPIWHDCSGKHAAWLRACVASGLPTENYLAPDHPIQVRVRQLIAEVGDHDVDPVGVDGCGAPVHRTTVRALARMYAVLATDHRFRDVLGAMHRYPALVSGVGNGDAVIATAVDAAAKRGAMGCIGIAWTNQFGIAVKSFDGHDRAAAFAAASGLGDLSHLSETMSKSLQGATDLEILGGGKRVGGFESRLQLTFL